MEIEEGPQMKLCSNENCKKGLGATRKKFQPEKPWGKYCCRECGDIVRRMRYYHSHKVKKPKT
jgi:hypothetical protein